MNDLYAAPWPLEPNRVSRFYRGGALLETFRGSPPAEAADGDRPEDWVGSTVRAWTPPGASESEEGLSRLTTGDGGPTLRSLLDADPAAVAGPALVERAGVTSGVLVKLLDAAIRLPVHAHPTRAFARRHLDSFFGKAEAWMVLATREIAGLEPPNVRLGFRRDVGRDELLGWIEEGRSA
jgi:mannose-6-phosphate isomerase